MIDFLALFPRPEIKAISVPSPYREQFEELTSRIAQSALQAQEKEQSSPITAPDLLTAIRARIAEKEPGTLLRELRAAIAERSLR